MRRVNSTGIPRDQLAWYLTQPLHVQEARRRDACLLCRAPKVNEAGLCLVCHNVLTEEELRLADKWTAGAGP